MPRRKSSRNKKTPPPPNPPQMPKPYQRVALRVVFEPLAQIVPAKIHPPYDTRDAAVAFRQAQQKIRLALGVVRLHRHAALHAACDALRLQIAGQKIALQHAHALRNPSVRLRRIPPEMLM